MKNKHTKTKLKPRFQEKNAYFLPQHLTSLSSTQLFPSHHPLPHPFLTHKHQLQTKFDIMRRVFSSSFLSKCLNFALFLIPLTRILNLHLIALPLCTYKHTYRYGYHSYMQLEGTILHTAAFDSIKSTQTFIFNSHKTSNTIPSSSSCTCRPYSNMPNTNMILVLGCSDLEGPSSSPSVTHSLFAHFH